MAYLYPAVMPDADGRAQGEYHANRAREKRKDLRQHLNEIGEGRNANPGQPGVPFGSSTRVRRNAKADRMSKEPNRLTRMLDRGRRP